MTARGSSRGTATPQRTDMRDPCGRGARVSPGKHKEGRNERGAGGGQSMSASLRWAKLGIWGCSYFTGQRGFLGMAQEPQGWNVTRWRGMQGLLQGAGWMLESFRRKNPTCSEQISVNFGEMQLRYGEGPLGSREK